MFRWSTLVTWCMRAYVAAALVPGAAWADAVPPKDGTQATYVVKQGDSLGLIAQRQHVSLVQLRKLNRLDTDVIRPGQQLLLPTVAESRAASAKVLEANAPDAKAPDAKTPDAKTPGAKAAGPRAPDVLPAPPKEPTAHAPEYYEHEVRPKEVLSLIAKRYSVSTKELVQLNGLGRLALIRVGQRLKIPVTDANSHLTRPKPWSKYARRNFERGKVTLKTSYGEWTGRVLDEKGHVLPEAQARIQSMLASWETGKKVQVALDPRLYRLIVRVSDEFGGRPIRVVSGYREKSFAKNSKHRSGSALDFSIPGIPNAELVEFLVTLPSAGVGYYPNSTHVHLDARSRSTYWVDTAGPGQAPRYVRDPKRGERTAKARSNAAGRPKGKPSAPARTASGPAKTEGSS